VLETFRSFGLECADWIGYSFGGRLLLEVLAAAPEVVTRAVFLDPAVATDAETSVREAEAERREVSFASAEDAVAARAAESPRAPLDALREETREHLVPGEDGRWRWRYLQSAVVAAFGEVAAPPPAPAAPIPSLLVRAQESWLVRDRDVDWLRGHIRGLEATTVPGGHIVLWEAFDETAAAVERFLARQ
jgi:lipase